LCDIQNIGRINEDFIQMKQTGFFLLSKGQEDKLLTIRHACRII
jgi:hypothetical protein